MRVVNQFSENEFAYEIYDVDMDEPRMLMGRRAGYETMNGSDICLGQSVKPLYTQTLTRLTFTAPDGTEVELRDKNSGGAPQAGLNCDEWGPSRGNVFVSADGSAMTFISDAPIRDNRWQFYLEHPDPLQNKRIFFPTGYLLFRDGTRFRIVDGNFAWGRDRNGNMLSFDNGYVDSLGRRTGGWAGTFPQGAGCGLHYDYKGYGGATRTLNFCYDSLSNRLRNTRPNDPTTTLTYEQLFWSLNWSYSNQRAETYNPPTISSIILPDNVHRYDFYYNQYGELARVVLPDGGAYEYDWDGTQPAESDLTILRRVTERRVYDAGGTLQSRTTYTREQISTTGTNYLNVLVRTYDGVGVLVAQTKHYFYGDPMYDHPRVMIYPKWRDGREYRVDGFEVVNGTPVLRRAEEHKWEQTPPSWWGPYSSDNAPPNNPRITEVKTTLIDTNQVSKKVLGHDQYNNTTDVWEYDFGAAPGGGALLRHAHTEYVNTYASPNPAFDSPHMRSLPLAQHVYDAGGTLRASSAYEYDNYASDAGHAGLVERFGITGLCMTYTAAGVCSNPAPAAHTARGNMTATTRHLLADNGAVTGSVTSYAQYDVAGNVVKMVDARGKVSEAVYGDSFCNGGGCAGSYTPNTYAFLTSTKSPKPDPTGAYGSATELVTSSVFDFWTGLVFSTKDANGQVTGAATVYQYNDPFDRVTRIDTPDGSWTSFYYDRSMNAGVLNDFVRTRTALDEARYVESYQFFDGLGRPTRMFINEGGSPVVFLTSDTQYDALGRAWRVSNPYRTNGSGAAVNPSGHWTETTFDTLGRVKQVKTTADGATVTTQYEGAKVLVTDQAGSKRISRTDAVGRLREIWEVREPTPADPDAESVSFLNNTYSAYRTAYAYDVLGNLRTVGQGAQTRSFLYDSLSRLTSATNPESGTVVYTYDPNNNLHTKTDARGVTATYTYDNLNRNILVSYSNGTPGVKRIYDTAVNGLGRYRADWTWDGVGAYYTHRAIDNYDDAGRPLDQRQYVLVNNAYGLPFTTRRTYDKAGNVLTQTYPSGHTVTYGYDAAGRLNSFTGNLGDGVTRTYSDQVTYGVFGGVEQERFGTQTPLFHKLHYNRRGQLLSLRLSTVPRATDQWNWNRGAIVNYYSGNYAWEGDPNTPAGPDNNGNLRRQQHWVPADDAVSGYAYTQDTYGYDALNRLTSVSEVHGGPWGQSGQDFAQTYTYDRWGNRTVNLGGSPNVPAAQYDFEQGNLQSTNRLLAPGDLNYPDPNDMRRRMRYDTAGNLTHDGYTGAGGRTFDAENRMTGAATDAYGNWAYYGYDADGRRVKRKIANEEWWQVYGMGGELLAEYPAGAAPFLTAKEYGYRGGQLLVTMSSGDVNRMRRFVKNLYYNALARDPSPTELQQKMDQLGLAGVQGGEPQLLSTARSIARGLFESGEYVARGRLNPEYVTDLYNAYLQRAPDSGGLNHWVQNTEAHGRGATLNAFEVSTEFATLAATLYGRAAAGDNQRVEHFVRTFYYGARRQEPTAADMQSKTQRLNATAAQGQSQVVAEARAIGGEVFVETNYNGSRTIPEYVTDLYEAFLQRSPDGPGLTHWVNHTQAHGRAATLAAFQQSIEFGELAGTLYRETFWHVIDHLGTPRMVVDRTGSLAGVKRHDYLPFGEELFANAGGRLPAHGYSAVDNVRQKFTGYERDGETGLDYARARYFANAQGRFISPDPLLSSGQIMSPQTWNRYSYALNSPLTYTDPSGAFVWDSSLGGAADDKDVSEEIRSRRQAVRNALTALSKKAASGELSQSEARKLLRAVQAFGAEGANNGVSIAVGRSSRESTMGTASNRLNVGTDGALSVSAKVTLDPSSFQNTAPYQLPDSVEQRLAHEGDHVANAQEYAFFYNGALSLNGDDRAAYEQGLQMMMSRDLTRFGNEMSAFTTSSIFLQASKWPASGEIGKSAFYQPEWTGWSEADRAAAREKGIEVGLAKEPTYGLIRGTNEGRRISDNIRK